MIGLALALASAPADAAAPESAAPAATPAATPSPTRPLVTVATSQLHHAEVLIATNRFKEARDLLDALAEQQAALTRDEANQLQFLLGLLDYQDGDYYGAVFHYRKVLASDPTAVRVRLELGRAFYMIKDYTNAERQFMFARAGKVPRTVRDNIDRYLNLVRAQRTFSYSFTLSLASDSNMNAGPGTDTVSLYGLPFQLSQSAKANSGIGLAVDAGAEYAPRLTDRLKWRVGALVHRAQYRETLYDDMTVSGYTGPHWTFKRWDLNLLGTVGRRWYGDRVYTDMYGGSLSATYYVTPRLGIGGAFALNQTDYAQNPLQSGIGGSVTASMFYTPTTSSVIRAAATVGKQDARDPALANHVEQFSLSYTKELAGGLTISLSPTFTHIAYEQAQAAFGTLRVDNQISGQVTLLDRKIDWGGITPRVAYTYTYNASTISLYRFKRSRLEIGITRAF